MGLRRLFLAVWIALTAVRPVLAIDSAIPQGGMRLTAMAAMIGAPVSGVPAAIITRSLAPLMGLPTIAPVASGAARAVPAVEAPSPGAARTLRVAAPARARDGGIPTKDDVRRLDAVFDGLSYPSIRRDESVYNYFENQVSDPYRDLENDSDETNDWVAAQNRLTHHVLRQIPERAELAARFTELWNYERVGTPSKVGKYWVYWANDGLQDQNVWYRATTLRGRREVLLDPNELSRDGTALVSRADFSHDGRFMAYPISNSGSDWEVWRVRDVETGLDLEDTIQWTKGTGLSWSKDGKGFYYTRFPKPTAGEELTGVNENATVYYHRLGEAQEKDVLIHERPDRPRWEFEAEETEDGRYLLLRQTEGTELKARIWVKDLSRPGAQFTPLSDRFDADYIFIGNQGPRFFFQTTKNAPRGKLVAVDIHHPAPENWKTLIPQEAKKRDVLVSVDRVGGRFVAVWMTDAHEIMRVYGPRGGFKYEVKLPTIGSVSGFQRASRKEKRKGFFTFSSYNHSRTHFRLNLETGKTRVFWRPRLPVDLSKFVVKQVFFPSKDGTMIPMFIVSKRGLKLDGSNPTYLSGYGGFGDAQTPWCSREAAAWLERGGVYAEVNLRGGGEYGEEWHDAGRLERKQNGFDDFIAAAEYLIGEKYTSASRLAIGGESNGGLLVGAVVTQRPDLFAAAVPGVGVFDMLRFHLYTVGHYWKSEYGSSETEDGFNTLIRYSPLHKARSGTRYPAVLIMTGDHDDRVVPAHSYKFAAALQAAQGGRAPILLRVERGAGHGGEKSSAKMIEEAADKWAFILKALGFSQTAP